MKKLIPALCLFLASCAASTVGKWDQMQATYNSVAEVAVQTAENPAVDVKTRKAIAEVIIRTAPVVEKGAVIASRRQCSDHQDLPSCAGVAPISKDDEAYLEWAFTVIRDAQAQLTAAYVSEVKP